jgi:hypothetical protein
MRVPVLKITVMSLVSVTLAAILARAQNPFEVASRVDAPSIAGRPVELDASGKLLPWPMPDNTGFSYSSHFLTQWTILWDQYNRQRLPYYYCCFDFDRANFELVPDKNWANSTAYLRAMLEGFVERLYPYTGDPHTLQFLQDFVDYELENGLTPADYVWAQVPYASANPGEKRYSGWKFHGEDYVEPPIIGEDGYAYLRLYEMTGNTKYLRAALRCAKALAKNFKPGDEHNSPWPVRCFARDGRVEGEHMGPYSANVVEPIMLFDELIRLNQGDVKDYQRVRSGAWDWLQKYPMRNNVWVGYFEDVTPSMGNMNQVIPLEYARYVLLHPELDPDWREHARKLIEWVKTTPKWPKYIVHGATVTTEQGNGVNFCCNEPNQCCDSHTSRLAAVEALYYMRTGDEEYKEAAYRSYNWVTYFQGLSAGAHTPFGTQWWFTDQYTDGPRRLMDAFWAVPEWAPADESHLLGSSSVVTRMAYGKSSVTYSTFDAESTYVLRLDFSPESVTADGHVVARRADLTQEGYTFDESTRVLRIRHVTSRDIDVQGQGGNAPPMVVTFDAPHQAAGTILNGEYPSSVINWGAQNWRIATPGCRFGTFNLALTKPDSSHAEFQFYAPRVFVGIDVCNTGSSPATLTLRAPDAPEISYTIEPGKLRRIRTGWSAARSGVTFDLKNGAGLVFDNLGYTLQ